MICDYMKKVGTSPSGYGLSWGKKEQCENILCHRPSNHCGTHVTLLCSTFAKFMEDCASVSPEADDCQFVESLCHQMSDALYIEKDRKKKLGLLLQNYLGNEVIGKSWAEYTSDLTISFSPSNAMIANIEVKGEKGRSGGDPLMQNLNYYMTFIENRGELFLEKGCCPCFLMTVVGVSFEIWGVCIAGNPCEYNGHLKLLSDPLATGQFLWIRADEGRMNSLVRTFTAFKHSLKHLSQYYSDLDKTLLGEGQLDFPTPHSFKNSEGSSVMFDYVNAMNHRTFMVRTAEDPPRELVVKFIHSYGKGAHQYCSESSKGAPKLITVEKMPFWNMVVMEYFENLENIVEYAKHEEDKLAVCQKLFHIISLLHAGGFVHGDLRIQNIQVNSTTDQVVILDFDTAGIEGEVKYPYFLKNKTDGIGNDGQLITKKDDLDLIKIISHRIQNL